MNKPQNFFSVFNLFMSNHFAYMAKHGIELLDDDKKWLRQVCDNGSPKEKIGELLNQYMSKWLAAMSKESLEHKKQNVGRFAANSFIRVSILGS